jgi:hypothetical protein
MAKMSKKNTVNYINDPVGSFSGDQIILLHIQKYKGKNLMEVLCQVVEKQKNHTKMVTLTSEKYNKING